MCSAPRRTRRPRVSGISLRNSSTPTPPARLGRGHEAARELLHDWTWRDLQQPESGRSASPASPPRSRSIPLAARSRRRVQVVADPHRSPRTRSALAQVSATRLPRRAVGAHRASGHKRSPAGSIRRARRRHEVRRPLVDHEPQPARPLGVERGGIEALDQRGLARRPRGTLVLRNRAFLSSPDLRPRDPHPLRAAEASQVFDRWEHPALHPEPDARPRELLDRDSPPTYPVRCTWLRASTARCRTR